jgi:30S ribosomal protein S31
MGKGDERTKRGKLFKGTFGKSRPRRRKKPVPAKAKPQG